MVIKNEKYETNKQSLNKRHDLIRRLNDLLLKKGVSGTFTPFGSCINELGFSNSDVDIFLTTEHTPMPFMQPMDPAFPSVTCCLPLFMQDESVFQVPLSLRWLGRILCRGGMKNVVCIVKARVPIIKFLDPKTGLNCDINITNSVRSLNQLNS
jgi:DNA polymerase sigma